MTAHEHLTLFNLLPCPAELPSEALQCFMQLLCVALGCIHRCRLRAQLLLSQVQLLVGKIQLALLRAGLARQGSTNSTYVVLQRFKNHD